MRIAWYSNSPGVPTGYGVQTTSVVDRMAADGHEVHVLANFGHRAGVRQMPNGVKVWPEGLLNYSIDTHGELARFVEADLVISLYDVWVLPPEMWEGQRVLSWTPIDHFPPPPEVMRWCRKHDIIAMSEWGAKLLREGGANVVATIPHTVEAVFRPGDRSARAGMQVPDDAFLITINAANIGTTPPRKAWDENLQALAQFLASHEDAYAYFHTDMGRPGGLPLPVLIDSLGISKEQLRVAPPLAYRLGMIDDTAMSSVYRASDVLLAVSMGEGFGIPVIEAMACGTPAIVSEFSAQPELVADTGWRAQGKLEWDHNQGAFFFDPDPASILECLEAAYAENDQQAKARREACAERATRWYADTVYAEQWRPLLASVEAEMAPKKLNRAQRRSQKRGKAA